MEARAFRSSSLLESNSKSGLGPLGGYFLLFIFTFKVGKSYENSVNHDGGTSLPTNNKTAAIGKGLIRFDDVSDKYKKKPWDGDSIPRLSFF